MHFKIQLIPAEMMIFWQVHQSDFWNLYVTFSQGRVWSPIFIQEYSALTSVYHDYKVCH